MNTLKDMFTENDNDLQELISTELREQSKYELLEVGCKEHNFKCAMTGLGFLLGTLTIAGLLSSYNSNSEINDPKPVIKEVEVSDKSEDISYFNSAIKPKKFYKSNSNFVFGSFYLNNAKVKNNLKRAYSLRT